jgi:hypothetical protein
MYQIHRSRSHLSPHQEVPLDLTSFAAEARRFFAPTAAAEIIAEITPLICPDDDTSIFEAAGFLTLLLPTNRGAADWLPQLMRLWQYRSNSTDWDLLFLSILARLLLDHRRAGDVSLQPYLPEIFSRVTKAIAVPVGAGASRGRSHNRGDASGLFVSGSQSVFASFSRVVVFSLHEPQTLPLLRRMLGVLEECVLSFCYAPFPSCLLCLWPASGGLV